MKEPQSFWLHFNRFGAKRNDSDVWTIKTKTRTRHVRHVDVRVSLSTVYRGDSARQPRAYLKGVGVITIKDKVATIS